MVDIKQSLRNFVATSNSGKYATEDEVFAKFPEFDGYDRQLLRNFVATSNSGKYATEEEVFAKFPEFNIDVKKKDQSQSGYDQIQPGSGSKTAQSSNRSFAGSIDYLDQAPKFGEIPGAPKVPGTEGVVPTQKKQPKRTIVRGEEADQAIAESLTPQAAVAESTQPMSLQSKYKNVEKLETDADKITSIVETGERTKNFTPKDIETNYNEYAKNALDDYLDYLNFTDQGGSQYQKTKERLDYYRSLGDKLFNDEQYADDYKRYLDLQQEAILNVNKQDAKYVNKLKTKYDWDSFNKKTSEVELKLSNIENQIKNISSDGGPLTPLEQKKYDDLLKQYNQIQTDYANFSNELGITEDVINQMSNSASRLAASQKAVNSIENEDNVNSKRLKEYKAQLLSNKKAQEEFYGDKDQAWYEQFGKGILNAGEQLGSSLIKGSISAVGDLPQVLTDAIGIDGYGFTDRLAEAADNINSYVDLVAPQLEDKDFPGFVKASGMIGNGLGSVGTFILSGGGATKAAQGILKTSTAKGLRTASRVGTFTAAASMGSGQMYDQLIEEGFTPAEASRYALAGGIVMGTAEMIVPEDQLLKNTVRRTFIGALRSKSTLKEASQEALKFVYNRSTDVLKNTLKEGGEEAIGQLAQDFSLQAASSLSGKEVDGLWEVQPYVDNFLAGGGVGGVIELLKFGTRNSKYANKFKESMLLELADNYDDISNKMSQIKPEDFNTIGEKYAKLKNVNNALKDIPGFEDLSHADKSHILALAYNKQVILDSVKQSGLDKSNFEKELTTIEEEIQATLNKPKDAVQKPSTEEVLPREQGATTETGGQPQGMGPSVQGQEVTQEGETEEQRQERIAKEASAGAAEVVTDLNAPNALAASVFPVVGEVEAQIEKGEFVSDEKSTEAQDKLYELLGDIDAREDLTPEQKQQMSAVIENRIQKIQDYDYRTRTETSTTTQTVAAGTTPKAQKQNERAAIPVRTVAEEGIDVTYDGRLGRIELRDGQYVFVPKKLGAVQARPVVIGEAAQVNAGSKFAGVENPTTGPNNSVANITLPNGSTLSVLNDDLSIDIGLEIAKQEVGAAPQALFDTVFEEVVTENKVEVPYLRETKPAQEQAATTEQISEQISEQKPTNIPPSTQQAPATEEKPAYTGNTTQDRALKDKYKADNLKRRILDQAQRIASALGKNTQVYVHETTEDYNKAIAERLGEDQKESTNGRFLYGDGVSEIHIDLSKANEKTLPHEAVHAVLYKAFGENEKLFQQFKDKLKPLLANSTVAELENFANQETYVRQGVTAEEFLAELGGVMTVAGNRIPKTTLQKITQLLNEFLSKITGGRIAPLSTGEVIDLFNSMAEAFASGKSIQSLMDSKGLIGSGKINGSVKSKQSINRQLPEQQERTSNFSKVKEIKLSDLNDKTGVLTGSDRLTTALLKFSDGSTMTLKGGIFYPSETGLVWASTDITGAKALSDKINQVIQEQGEAWLFPVNNAYGSQKSNYTFFEVAMNHLKVAVKQRGVKKDQLIEKLNKFKKTKKYENAFKVGYKPKVFTQSLSNKNLEEIYSMLHKDFLPENATYPGRLSFIESFFGGPNTKSRPFDTVPNTAELIEMTTEPVNGDSRAFTTSSAIKITGKVNPRETTNDGDGELFHSSYPAVIESEGSVESYVLDGTYPIEEVFPEFKKANGETVNWEDVKKEEIEKGNEPSFENYKNKIISAQGSIPRIAKVKSKSQVSDQEFESLPGSDLTQLDFRELSIPKLKSKSQISNKKKEEFKKMLEKKRPDLKERGLIDSVIEDVEKFGEENSQDGKGNPKLEKLALHWIYNANLILPEDGYKVVDAEKVATKNKVDPFGYSSPESLMDAFRDTIKEKPIDPDTIPTFTNKKEIPGSDIVVYDVDDTKEGQEDVRKIIDTHFGKDANPWCLAARIDGSLDKAWSYWQNYNAVDKKIAFINGKLIAFKAIDMIQDEDNDEITNKPWWDRTDTPSKGIPSKLDLGDNKKQDVFYDEDGKIIEKGGISRISKTKKELWRADGSPLEFSSFKDGKLDGIHELFHHDGTIYVQEMYKEGLLHGMKRRWDMNEKLLLDAVYENGKLYSETQWYRKGNIKSKTETSRDYRSINRKEYYDNGNIWLNHNYKVNNFGEWGLLDGLNETYWENGQKQSESNYKDNEKDGLHKAWYRNGQLEVEENYKNGFRHGIKKRYNSDGTISDELNYKNGKKYGVQKSYYNDGSYTETYINEDGTIKYSKEILPDKESSSNIKSKSQVSAIPKATTESKDMMSEFDMAANKTGLAKENSVRRFVEKYGEKGLVAKEINDNFEKIQEQLGITKICNI